ncbi:glycosyltransferase family 4 protein [Methanobrevibacter sp. UBA417]|jgi:glycosyltransferase involved in cell wall biosynthesis|uniref:glycosyltransferase family 4 protein n=1 Tax=Methanobrevibacter sp. UBA417 TaxID=1915487 RepID=UPI0039B88078
MDITLISRYFNTKNGGAGSHSKLIYEGLKKRKQLNLNILSQDESFISSYNQLSYLFFTSLDLKRLLNKEEYQNQDIYHALTPLESKYINKRKGVASVLDFIPLMEKAGFMSNLFANYFNDSIKQASQCERVIANNQDIKSKLIESYNVNESSIEVIPPPINDNFYPKDNESNVFTVGTISNLMTRKRVNILIESFLKADIPNSQLLIGGNGVEKDNLIKLAANDKRIKFVGFVPDDKMNDFYNILDVFVFPTKVEGYGMPIVEAMACGKPVITLKDSIIPSDIKNRTIICEKDELTNILKSESFDFNKKDNINFYKQHSIDKITDKIINVYESI